MDAKRLIPVLEVFEGRTGQAPAAPILEWAKRLELAGADELLLVETAPAGADRAAQRCAWIRELAHAVFIPLGVSWADPGHPHLAEALEAGADRVLLRLGPDGLPDLAQAAQRHGRDRLRVAVDLTWSPIAGWRVATPGASGGRPALDWLTELGRMGAGELLLSVSAAEAPVEELGQMAATLPLPVLFWSEDPAAARKALLHGADGWAYPGAQGLPQPLKAALAQAGLTVRQ